MKRICRFMSVSPRRGFTLLEVLVVVVIAVLVTMFAVPAYRKSQERNKYMAAVGVLMELGNAANMLKEQYPDLSISSLSYNSNGSGTCPEVPTGTNIKTFLLCHSYVTEIPFQSGKYQGYSFKISTIGNAICSGCSKRGMACMFNTSALATYKCVSIDKNGILYNN